MLPVIIIGGILFFISFFGGISSGKGDARFIAKKWVFKDVNPFVNADKYYNFSIPGAVFYKNMVPFFGGGITIFIILHISNSIFKYTDIGKISILAIIYSGTFLISDIISTLISYKREEKYSEKIKNMLIPAEQMDTVRYWQSAGINSAEWREWTSWFNEIAEKITWGYSSYINFPPWKMDK